MAKLAPGDLAQVLSKLPNQNDERIVVGFDNADDAGVYRLDDERLLVQTLDFFTPVADEPSMYGRIAAMNSVNDVYAMGGTPITALSIVCFPQKGDFEMLGEILAEGQRTMIEEGVAVLGGHSVDDSEIKIGYSVTGIVSEKDLVTNAGAKPGDALVLTKRIGTGIINTAVKFAKCSKETERAALETMAKSSAHASKEMKNFRATACTDVTGFGLLGHAFEMAEASDVTLQIESDSVELLPDVCELIEQKMLTRGDRNNRTYVGETIHIDSKVDTKTQSALFDPQTSGGLLITIPNDQVDGYLERVPDAFRIGIVKEKGEFLLEVI